MTNKLYKIDGFFVNANSTTSAIKKLKQLKKIKFTEKSEPICEIEKIVPTIEKPEMKIFKIYGNEFEGSEFNHTFIVSANASDAFDKYKELNPKATRLHAKLICFRNEVIKA